MTDVTSIKANDSSANRLDRQAFAILRLGFTVAPIIAGADKFLHLLTNWDKYLSLTANNMLVGNGYTLMLAVGFIEIVGVIGVFFKLLSFSWLVSVMRLFIVWNLVM